MRVQFVPIVTAALLQGDLADLVREVVFLALIALLVILVTRRLTVPYTLGLVVVGLLIGVFNLAPEVRLTPDLVLFVFLPALLFEGAWSLSIERLRENWKVIFLLAFPGLLLSLVLIAVPLHAFAGLTWLDAFLLAAILSPTDPIAVLGLFRQLSVNEQLATVIEAESLFNDGVAGALYQTFLALVLLSINGQDLQPAQAWGQGLSTFLLEGGGSVLVGLACGYIVTRGVRLIDDPLIETTITIVTAYGVYLIADFMHMSGILAVICAGLVLGSYGRTHGLSERTLEVTDNFWAMSAFLVNALLFLLVGAQINPVQFFASPDAYTLLLKCALVVGSVLVSRLVMVLLIPSSFPPFSGMRLRSWRFVIFWSGLRGALSLALVLALPLNVPDRNALIYDTYAVVLFTLLGQGLSLRSILKKLPSVTSKLVD